MTILKLTDICKDYLQGKQTVRVLKNINLTVEQGDYLAIMGPSGSGKSTLMNIIGCLDVPTSGSYELNGKSLPTSDNALADIRNKYIGFVFQSYNLMPQYTAVENVELPLMLRGIGKRERRKQALAVMEQVGIVSHAEHKPSELSGGQQQRVGIARALITKPPIVFADELTGNLDTKTSAEIMDLLTGLFRESGTTFMLVSHDPDMSQYTDRTIHLLDGKIISEETNQSVRR